MREARKAYEALMKWYPFGLEDLPGEEWLPVPDWQDYQVSTFGRVKSFKFGKVRIKKPPFSKGYLFVKLHGDGKEKIFKVHRLVALAFIPNPLNKPEVNHRDGCKLNNFIGNLEWVTGSENQFHSFAIGLQVAPQGEDSPNAKLTNEQARYIRANPLGLTVKQLAQKFGVDQVTISDIQRGRKYKTAGGSIRQANPHPLKVSREIREQIRAEYVYGSREFGSNALAKKYGVNGQTILNIIKERT